MDQRLVAEVGQSEGPATGVSGLPALAIPVKRAGRIIGSQGSLAYVALLGHRQRRQKGVNFQLKQPITEARCNEIWPQIEKKNGRIQ
jgi:hypothetical protein